MKVGDSVRKAIDDFEKGDFESAMLHACNAIDGTAKKVYPSVRGNQDRFTRLLRENYEILGAMGAPGVDLVETRFPVVVRQATTKGGKPDIADIIYSIHRCSHGHGDELPEGFDLLSDVNEKLPRTRMSIEKGKVHLSDRIIFGLLAVAIFSPVNKYQLIPETFYLTYCMTFFINKWWGHSTDFMKIIKLYPIPSVKLDFSAWDSNSKSN